MLEKLNKIKNEYGEITQQLNSGKILDSKKLTDLSKRQAELKNTVNLIECLEEIEKQIKENQEIIREERDQELIKMAEEELVNLEKEKSDLTKKLEIAVLPKDPNDNKNVIVEIRAGAGGDEAALFAANLFRMYSKYAESRRWKIEIINSNRTGIGGFKEIIFSIKGNNVYKNLKYESGVHRVQRVPETEKSGRIHTSTATVAILPEAEDVEIDIDAKDLKVDTFRSSGPGGQSVNTTDSAIRITYLPTNLVVTCQDEKSQHKNKAKALKVLKSRLLFFKQEEEGEKRGKERKMQIGTGDRSEKIRTYNFPQDRITDHRIKFSMKNLPGVLGGKLGVLVEKLKEEDKKLRRSAFSGKSRESSSVFERL